MDFRRIGGWLCLLVSGLLFLVGWWQTGNSLWIVEAASFWSSQDASDLVEDGWDIYGRVSIPDIGFEADLFYTDETDVAQEVVDARGSAAWIPNWDVNMPLIADHDYQGFKRMRDAVPGETVAVIDFGDRVASYICTDVFEGWNIDGELVDINKETIIGRNDGGIAMYTCNVDLWKETITISFWRPILPASQAVRNASRIWWRIAS